MNAFLTIDDAPSAELTAKLEVLEAADASALLFCEGRRLAEQPEQARRALEAGFHLGNHTYSHRCASELSVEEFETEIDRTEALLEDAYDRAGVARPARVFRFPHGDAGGDRADRLRDVPADRGFAAPCAGRLDGGARGDEDGDRDRVGTREGYDWSWTFGVEDWTTDSEAELRERVDSTVGRSDRERDEIVPFHDAGNSTALFGAFLARLRDHGFELVDPLRSIPGDQSSATAASGR